MRPVIILTPNPPSCVGGVERFAFSLKNVLENNNFPVETIDYSFLGLLKSCVASFPVFPQFGMDTLFPYIIAQRIKRKYSQSPIIISNGLLGWAVDGSFTDCINVYHGCAAGLRRSLEQIGYSYRGLRINEFLEKLSGSGKTIIAVSENVNKELKKYYNLDSFVIENCVDVNLFKPLDNKNALRKILRLPENEFLGLFVGRNEPNKGVKTLSGISNLLPSGISVVSISNTPIGGKRTINYGWDINILKMPLIYSAVDFLIFPSLYEGCSYTVLEAMSCGLPIIARKSGHLVKYVGTKSLLSEFILDTQEPTEYVDAILRLKNSPDLSLEFSMQVRKEIVLNNSMQKFERSYLSILSKNIYHN